MLKTIFLDLDDTILDFRGAERRAVSETLRCFGIDPTPALTERYHALNRRQWELLEEGKLTRPQVLTRRFELLFGELGLSCRPREVCALYEELLAQNHMVLPGALELLETLVPRYDLYAATNGASDVQNARLRGAGLLPYFQKVFISEELGADKPGLAFFRACFDAIPGFDPAAALMVGDSLTSDIRGARNAGLRSCWYNPRGLPPRPDIAPDFTIRELWELPPLLERL